MSTMITMILWMLMGVATSYFAFRRGRDPYIWFALGIFFGVLAMLVLVLLPSLINENELEVDRKNQAIVEGEERRIVEEEKIENAPNLLPQSVQTKDWFYLDKARQQQGPFSFYIVSELWQNGELEAQSLVWTEGMVEWKKIVDAPELFEALEQIDLDNRKTFPEDL